MRKILAVLLMLSFCSWANPGYTQDLKVGFIDLKKVMDDYKKVKDGEDQLREELQGKDKQRDELVKEIKNLREKLDLLKDEKKEKKQQELDEKVKKLQDFTYQSRTDLRQNKDEKLREIMKEIKGVIEEYGQSRNYNVIFDRMLLHYADDSLDVTDDIVKTLNQRYKK